MTISRKNHHSFNVQFHFKSRPVLFNSGDLAVNKIKCISNIEQQLTIAPTQLKLECQQFFFSQFPDLCLVICHQNIKLIKLALKLLCANKILKGVQRGQYI